MNIVFELGTQVEELQRQYQLKINEAKKANFVAAKSKTSTLEDEADEDVSQLEHELATRLQEWDGEMQRVVFLKVTSMLNKSWNVPLRHITRDRNMITNVLTRQTFEMNPLFVFLLPMTFLFLIVLDCIICLQCQKCKKKPQL